MSVKVWAILAGLVVAAFVIGPGVARFVGGFVGFLF
jgi:hypothetical protein